MTLTDFYGMWLNLKLKMERGRGTYILAQYLFAEMQSFDKAIEIPIMHAALYLDPRYNILLSDRQKTEAVGFLESLYNRIKLSDSDGRIDDQHIDDMTEDMFSLDMLSNFITNIRRNTPNNIDVLPNSTDIRQLLEEFNDQEDLTKPVLGYWDKQKFLKPELYQLANILYSIPPTQSSVERAFSALALILTPLRTQLSAKVLSEILLVRLNKSLYFSGK